MENLIKNYQITILYMKNIEKVCINIFLKECFN